MKDKKGWPWKEIRNIAICLILLAVAITLAWVFSPKDEVRQVPLLTSGDRPVIITEIELEEQEFLEVAKTADKLYLLDDGEARSIAYVVGPDEDGILYKYNQPVNVNTMFHSVDRPVDVSADAVVVAIKRDVVSFGVIFIIIPFIAVVFLVSIIARNIVNMKNRS